MKYMCKLFDLIKIIIFLGTIMFYIVLYVQY
jgi:hypothetical protein